MFLGIKGIIKYKVIEIYVAAVIRAYILNLIARKKPPKGGFL